MNCASRKRSTAQPGHFLNLYNNSVTNYMTDKKGIKTNGGRETRMSIRKGGVVKKYA